MTDQRNNCWKVYFRKDDTEDWLWECGIRAITLTHIVTNGKMYKPSEWDNEPYDPNEGRMALHVIRNQKLGLESILCHEYDELYDDERKEVSFHGRYD